MPKILVIRFSSIGDIVLTTPVLRVLKKSGATVHVATKAAFRGIMESNPNVDKVHVLGDKLNDFISELRKENFEFVADLHNNLRSNIIRFRLGKKSAAFPKLNFRKWWLVLTKQRGIMPDVHIVSRYLQTLVPLNLEDDGKGLDYFIPEKDKVGLSSLPGGFQNSYVAFAIGAQHATKRLPVHRIIEALALINAPVILLGGKEDRENGELIVQKSTRSFPVYNACGLYNLNQSASLVQQAHYVVSHDTGLMHIAAAFQKEIFSVWGNTVPELGMYPFRTRFHILENNNLSCRPCSKLGYNECPQKHFNCMEKLDLSVLKQINK
jgi:ADP-heptose:LPS heptosyltransferase